MITEQKAVAKFLIKKHKSNREIIEELSSVYGTHTLTKATVKKWVGRFCAGRTCLQDDHREGRPATAVNTILREQVKICTDQDCHKQVDIATSTKISKSSVRTILQQELNMWKVCSKMMPKVLTLEQKQARVFMAETPLNDQLLKRTGRKKQKCLARSKGNDDIFFNIHGVVMMESLLL